MTIYLIRHAQSAFNAVHDPNKPDPMIFDAPITELGKTQAIQARSEVEKLEIKNVIVSPFTRTLQTALLIFGKNIPFQINAIVREQLCNSCDVGSKPRELSMSFPDFNFDHLSEFVASKILKNDVVGWFQGRMEWGPRALGNRSILANPKTPNMKDIINSKIKNDD